MPPRSSSSADTGLIGSGPWIRLRTSLALAGVLSGALAAAAGASTGGSEGGGAMYVEKPKVAQVACIRRCASRRRAQPRSTLKIIGSGFSSARAVVFHGSYGSRDDIEARVRPGSSERLQVRVPMGAVTGPVSVETAAGIRSRRTRAIQILPPPPPDPNPTLTPVPGPRQRGAPRLETGTSRTKAFYGARRTVTFSYRITGGDPATVAVELVRAADGAVVQRWTPPAAQAGRPQSVVWNGNVGRTPALPGRYSFRLTVAGRTGAIARSAQASDFSRDAFDLFDHQFPIRGRHDYGGSAGRFGAGRAGHSHQGQDVFARCGTRLVAARGGVVETKAYHRRAGNYLVIDGAGSEFDYAYMHLAEPSPFEPGDRVYTGQRIGAVGETGRASGCHLHFELWSAPGWYDGGRPLDPLAPLRAWDAYS